MTDNQTYLNMKQQAKCALCGEPMPEGETMFKFHGYSGPCPKPPLKKTELDPAGVPKVDLTELERFAVQLINKMKALSDDGSVVLPLDIQMHIDAFLMTVTVRRVGVLLSDKAMLKVPYGTKLYAHPPEADKLLQQALEAVLDEHLPGFTEDAPRQHDDVIYDKAIEDAADAIQQLIARTYLEGK